MKPVVSQTQNQFLLDCFLQQWYREVFCDKIEQFRPFSLVTGCIGHQYFQWLKDVDLGYNLQKKKCD